MKSLPLKWLLGILLLLLIIGIFVLTRSAEHMSQNFVFVLDQGRDYVFVRDMIVNKKLTLIGSEIGGGYAGFQGIFQGPVHFYLLSIFFLLFNGNPYGGVVYMGLFALFAVITAFLFGKYVFRNSLYGLALALLITMSPPLIAQAKFVWNPYPITFFLLLTFLFVYLSLQKEKKYIFLATFFAAFTYNFEIATTVPLLMTVLLFYIFVVRLRTLKEYGLVVGGIVAGMFPFFLFEVRHHFIAVNGFIKYLSSSGGEKSYGLINNQLSSFFYNFTDTFPHQTFVSSTLILLAFVAFLILFVWKEKRVELKKFLFFLVMLTASTIFVLSFLRNHIFMYYLYQLNLVYILLFVYLVYASIQKKRYEIFGFLVLVLGIYSFFAVMDGMRDYKNDSKDVLAYQKIKAKIAAVDYIYTDAKKQSFGVFVFAPAVFTYPYDYLIWWRGEKQYHYQPTQSKAGLFYLLIEEDPGKPWTYKGWMETVIKEGRVLETKKLPSGLIVQKRCGPHCPLK